MQYTNLFQNVCIMADTHTHTHIYIYIYIYIYIPSAYMHVSAFTPHQRSFVHVRRYVMTPYLTT